jgi:RimJ/RimL family protein N-acetyltransferase
MSTSKRCVIFDAKDGSRWAVAGEVIAHNRASYYAEDDPETTYEAEFEHTITDRYELIDWLGNNMNAEDVVDYAVCVRPARPLGFCDVFGDDETNAFAVDAEPAWNLPMPPTKGAAE